MGWLFLIFLFCFLLAVAHWVHWNLTKPLPGPWGIPILFNLHSAIYHNMKQDVLEDLVEGHRRFGRTFIIRLPPHTIVFSTDPKDVSYVLSDNFENWKKPEKVFHMTNELFGKGIFAANGANWAVQRKALSNAFRVTDIKHSLNVFRSVTKDVISVLNDNVGKEVDVMTLFASATLAGFTESSLSMKFCSVSLEESDFAFHFNRLMVLTMGRVLNPLYRWMPFLPSERKIRESAAFLNSLAYDAIKEARKRDSSHPKDLLSSFLDHDTTDEYLRDVFINVLVAGRDTTSQTLAWCCYHLSKNLEVQNKLRAELERLGHSDAPQWKVHVDGALPYLNAVIKETLRLAPPVPVDIKSAINADTLPGSGAQIPAGTIFDWAQWISSRDEANFDEPDRFWPERWLNESAKTPPSNNQPPWMPFQYGPRVCLGLRLAMNTLELMLQMLILKFEFLPGSVEPRPILAITLSSGNGINLRVQKIQE